MAISKYRCFLKSQFNMPNKCYARRYMAYNRLCILINYQSVFLRRANMTLFRNFALRMSAPLGLAVWLVTFPP